MLEGLVKISASTEQENGNAFSNCIDRTKNVLKNETGDDCSQTQTYGQETAGLPVVPGDVDV